MEDQLMKWFSTVSCVSSLRARIADQPAPQAKLTLARFGQFIRGQA